MEAFALIFSMAAIAFAAYFNRDRDFVSKHQPEDAADLPDQQDTVIITDIDQIDDNIDYSAPEFDGDLKVAEPIKEARPKHRARYMWCLNWGHGKKTAGKRSPVMKEHGVRLYEYEINRDIGARMKIELDLLGIEYFEVVPEINVGNFLEERVARANNLASELPKIYVSVHFNAGPADDLNTWTLDASRGVETWHYHASSRGRKLAGIFQRHLLAATGWKNRGVRSQVKGEFYELRATRMPSIVLEGGFFNNYYEARELMKSEVRQSIAMSYVEAIVEVEMDGL